MVDINLIGDDQTQFEPDENEKEFQDAYGGEGEDFSQDSFMRSDTFDTTDYSNMIKKGGSKTGVIILFIIVVGLLAATAYVLFKPSKTQQVASMDTGVLPEEVEMQEVPPEDSAASGNLANLQEPSNQGTQPAASTTAPVTIPSTVLDLIAKSYSGFRSINQLVNSLPPTVNFTIITYNDGKVLFELLSNDQTSISDIDAILNQKIPGAKITSVSHGIKNIKGRQYFQAILKGELITPQSAGASVTSTPRYLTFDEMQQLITRVAGEKRVRLLEIQQGTSKIENGVSVLPLTMRISGLKDNLLQTMKGVLDENVNLSFVKISLVAKELEIGNPQMTLILNVNLFQTTA